MVCNLLQPGLVEGVAGVNLPMLVRAMTYRHGSMFALVEKAISGGRQGVVYFNNEGCERYE
jgi:PTS system ascorbate-specific IIA component